MSKKDMYYQGNIRLKAEGVKLDYTKEQIKEIKRCKRDIHYFVKNYVYIVNIDLGVIKFDTYDFQDVLLTKLQNNKRVIVKFPRQCGKTTTTAAYILHEIIFRKNRNVAILANKQSTAREILAKVKEMYELLPLWMQQGVCEWNKGSFELENGSRVISSATSSSAIRGMSISTLVLDEFAFIEKGVFEEFYASVYPTVSSSKSAKIFMISTPFGMNHFYKFWVDAINKRNDFDHYEIEWNRVPNRDDEWRLKTISEIGAERFRQEFECEFLGSSGTLINGASLKNLVHFEPRVIKFDDKFYVYELPVTKHQYVAICDVAEGVGGDYSTIQVIDVTTKPYSQVAMFRCNEVKTTEFPMIIQRIGDYYNEALVIVESNSIGDGVINDLNYDLEYENLFFHDSKLGIRMTKNTKRIGNSFLKTFIEDQRLIVKDFETISEFSKYIKTGDTYKGENDEHDDLITPLVLFAYFMNVKEWVEDWLDQDVMKNKKMMDKIEDDLLPLGFISDGDDVMCLDDDDEYYDY